MNRADKEVIVIGGGLGGLFAAAILSVSYTHLTLPTMQ